IINGMSHTLMTDDYYSVTVFFVDCLKPKPVDNQEAPSPDDIAGRQIQMTAKEKEIITKAYEGLKFANGKAVIQSSSFSHLDLLATLMTEKADYKLNIRGYTDNVGKPESNVLLSKNRANAVKDYLVKK